MVKTFKHKGEFSVITVGTGSPAYSPKRSGPSTLIHFGPGETDKEATIGIIQELYHGEIIFGRDLLEVIP